MSQSNVSLKEAEPTGKIFKLTEKSHFKNDGYPNAQTDTHTDTLADGHAKRYNITSPLSWLSKIQIRLLRFLISENGISSFKRIERATSIKYGTIRGSLAVLAKKGLISRHERYRNGMFQGIKYTVSHIAYVEISSGALADTVSDMLIDKHSYTHLEEETLFLNIMRNFSNFFPHLHQLGFEEQHLRSIIAKWKEKIYDLSAIEESLDRIEYVISTSTCDSAGSKPGLGYYFTALCRAPFAKPKGYISLQEQAAMDAANRLMAEQKKAQALAQAEEIELQNAITEWFAALPRKEQFEIDAEAENKSKRLKIRENKYREWILKNAK